MVSQNGVRNSKLRTWVRGVSLGGTLCGVFGMLVLIGGCPPVGGGTCTDNAGCEDMNICTTDTCDVVAGTCTNAPVAGCCQTDADCTGTATCTANECVTPCTTAADCDDNDACTDDACTAGICANTAISCDDMDACTTDTCDAATGCANDAVVCTAPDVCNANTGECGVPCTADADCDDGLFCTGDETCDVVNGACQAGTDPCEAGQTCIEATDTCSSVIGETFILTTAVAGDAFTGTANNDLFIAAVGTLQTVDILVGNGGDNDVLDATVAGTSSTSATIIDIDVVNFTTLNATTFNAVNAAAIGIWNIVAGSTGSLTMTNVEADPTFTLPSGYAKVLTVSQAGPTTTSVMSIILNGTAAGAGFSTSQVPATLATLNIAVNADSSLAVANTGTSFFSSVAVLNGANNVTITGSGMLTWTGGVAGDLVADTYNFTGFTGNTGASMANSPGATNVSTLPRFVRYTINDTAGGQNHAVTLAATHNNVTFDVLTVPALAGLGTLTIIQGANNDDSATVNYGGAGTGSGQLDASAGTEFLTINSGGTTANAIANVLSSAGTAFVTESITLVGAQNVTLGTVTTESFDASAFTGTMSMTAANTMQINGGSGVDTITGSAGVDLINGNGGNDVIVAAAGNDIIDGGAGNDSIDGGAGVDNVIGGTGVDTLRVSAAAVNGADRGLFTDFDDTATTGDVVNLNTGVATLTGTDNFATAATIQTHGAAGGLVVLAATEVVIVTSATVADLTSANSLNGTNLLTAVGGTITGAIGGQNNILVVVADAAGNVGVYHANSADNAIIAAEYTLIAVLSGANVTLANMVFGNFANAL